MIRQCLATLILLLLATAGLAQIDSVHLNQRGTIEYPGLSYSYYSLFDRNTPGYAYAASVTDGLYVYDVSDLDNPSQVDLIPASTFGGLDVTSLYQEGSTLYVSLGNFQGSGGNPAGVALLNVTDPNNVSLIGQWDSTAFDQGSAVVRKEGDFLYLGMMEYGVAVIDVSTPSQPSYVSHFVPDQSWPGIASYSPNARGMTVRNDTLYLAYDAGGLRLIDCSNKSNLTQISQHVHASFYNPAKPPAYNHVILKDQYALIAIDWCGLEVVDLTDPLNPASSYWWDPNGCSAANWEGSPIHTNELFLRQNDSLLFMTGGDSEIYVMDVSDVTQPEVAGSFAVVDDSLVTWGIDIWQNQIITAHVDNGFFCSWPFQPYCATKGGIGLYDWQLDYVSRIEEQQLIYDLAVYPNPFRDAFTIELEHTEELTFQLLDLTGRTILNGQINSTTTNLNTNTLPAGHYLLRLSGNKGHSVVSLIKY